MKNLTSFLAVTILCITSFSQDSKSYDEFIEDPDNVDIRRAEVGLGTLQEYLSEYGMVWDAEEHKKRLPEYEEKTRMKNPFKP